MIIDAFPLDVACQEEQHGFDGRCDFDYVVPADPTVEICPDGDGLLDPTLGAGTFGVEKDSSYEPLCNGWVLITAADEQRVFTAKIFTGRRGPVYDVGGVPADLELDSVGGRLFVALPEDRHHGPGPIRQ